MDVSNSADNCWMHWDSEPSRGLYDEPKPSLPQPAMYSRGTRSACHQFFETEELLLRTLLLVHGTYSLTNLVEVSPRVWRIITGTRSLNKQIRNCKANRIHRLLRLGSGTPIFDLCNRQRGSMKFGNECQCMGQDALLYLNINLRDTDFEDLKELNWVKFGIWGLAKAIPPGRHLRVQLRANGFRVRRSAEEGGAYDYVTMTYTWNFPSGTTLARAINSVQVKVRELIRNVDAEDAVDRLEIIAKDGIVLIILIFIFLVILEQKLQCRGKAVDPPGISQRAACAVLRRITPDSCRPKFEECL